MRLAARFRGVLSGAGGGGLALCQTTPERSQSAMDVSAETLISQLRQHAPVCSERFRRAQPAIIRLLGAWHSNIEQRCGSAGGLRRPCHRQTLLWPSACSWKICSSKPVDLVTEQALRQELRPAVEADAIPPLTAIRKRDWCRTRRLALGPSRFHWQSQCLGFATT